MAEQERFDVINLTGLAWPASVQIPCKRFRLFVAADTSNVSVDAISDFASAALRQGMVYFCVWGRGCERFHDIVDEIVVADELGNRKFAGPLGNDVVMTTWHDDESLEEALSFFTTCAVPTEGLADDSDFRLVICVGNSHWTDVAERLLQSAKLQ